MNSLHRYIIRNGVRILQECHFMCIANTNTVTEVWTDSVYQEVQ
jgi:hypothetical protein